MKSKKHNLKQSLKLSHTPLAVRERLEYGVKHSYLKDFIYGAIDGAVTTFAVVSGVAGAGLSSHIIIILGMANLIGDGFSMAASNFLGTRAEEQLREKARQEEEIHIKVIPEGEREEIRQIFASKGFEGADLEKVVNIITSDSKTWIDTMLTEELGMALEGPNPWKAALSTFFAFMIVGVIPLLVFVYQWMFPKTNVDPYFVSALMTGVAFFCVGAVKARFINYRWYISGLETLCIGGSAAFLAYLAGVWLSGII